MLGRTGIINILSDFGICALTLYVTHQMLNVCGGSHLLHFSDASTMMHTAPTKRHSSPVEVVLTGSEATLLGLIEIPRSPQGTRHY